MSDARKRALELARRRAKQRQNATAERDRKEKDKNQRDKEIQAGVDPQQSYLEKQRQREEKRKQEERDLLQREMEKLQRKQREVKDSELKKKEALKKKQEEELTLLKEERKKQKIAEQQKDNEILRLKKQAEEEKKLFERKLREQVLQSSALKSNPKSQAINQHPIIAQSKIPTPTIKKISQTKVTRITSKNIENNFELDQEILKPNTLYSDDMQFESSIAIIATPDPIKRRDREDSFLQSHPDIQDTITISKNFSSTAMIINMWNAQLPLEPSQIPELERFAQRSLEETIFWDQIKSKSHLWLPFVSYNTFYSVIHALSAKNQIDSPRKLKIFVDLSEEIIAKALIDGIQWGLIIPHFSSASGLEGQLEATISFKNQINTWYKWVPKCYHKIQSFSISEEFMSLTSPKIFRKFMIAKFLNHDIIRDFLHGISSRSQKYALKSQMFEKSLLKLFPSQSLNDLNMKMQNIVDYAEEFGLISVSDPLRYKSGSSQFISITTFGHQKIQNFNKKLSSKSNSSILKINPNWGYKADYQCNNCGYDLKTDFEICPQCGDIKIKKCRKCHQLISNEWDICPYCGLSQQFSLFT
ncbi:hypothetical protein WKT22_04331 [Candidatus Lokiarchaeum ossiferum]